MHNDLLHLAEIFKERRKELNFTLKEVENATSIRMSYLEAIEDGQLTKLISPIYAQGFIKKYASFLDIDGDALIKDHPYVVKLLNDNSDKQEFSFGIGTMEVRGSPGGEVKWLPNFLWVLISVALIVGGFFLAKFFDLV